MGAHDFTDYAEGKDARKAYSEAVQVAHSEHGHDGYNGTISTTNGVYPLPIPAVSMDEARSIAQEETEATFDGNGKTRYPRPQKWEACNAIPVAEDKCFRWRTPTRTFSIDGDKLHGKEFRAKLAEAANLKDGERLVSYNVTESKVTAALETKATKGKTVSVFSLIKWHGDRPGPPEGQYATQAEARKAMDDYMRSERGKFAPPLPDSMGVISTTYRRGDDGSLRPLVVSKRKNKRTKVTVAMRIAANKTARPPVKGWLFYGIAAS